MTRADVIDRETDQWIIDNPRIFAAFEDLAMEEVKAGRRFSMRAICEGIRWNSRLKWDGPYKISHTYVSRIGRRLLAMHPEIEDYCRFDSLPSRFVAA